MYVCYIYWLKSVHVYYTGIYLCICTLVYTCVYWCILVFIYYKLQSYGNMCILVYQINEIGYVYTFSVYTYMYSHVYMCIATVPMSKVS